MTGSANAPKPIASQAQYQLVLCMLRKGDRAAATREFQLLEKNFPDNSDLISKARKLIPSANSLLPASWLDGEASQLNIKRDGAPTGETLFYSADPWQKTVYESQVAQNQNALQAQTVYLRWELTTRNSIRSIQVAAERDTLRPLGGPSLDSDDVLGDATVAPFLGPATDKEQSGPSCCAVCHWPWAIRPLFP